MDLIKVVQANDQWLSVDLIEGHNSFIWSSRFIPAGDFEYRTYDIDRVYSLLQKGDYVKNDTGDNEVCIVESRVIEKNDDGRHELIVRGRSYEAPIMERRAMWDSNVRPNFGSYPAWFVMGLLIARSLRVPNIPQDAIPKVNYGFSITGNSGPYDDENWAFDYKATSAYANLKAIMEKANIGVHAVQSGSNPSSDLYLIIHDGADRTINQTARTPVILSTKADDIKDAQYADDDSDYRNVAYINAPIGFRIYPSSANLISGANRRVLQINADDLTEVPSGMTAAQALDSRAALELAQHNRKSFFDGTISEEAKYIYQRDYYLGDKVTVQGDYGPSATMQVTEYIKSSSPAGDFEFPTLAQVI